MRTLLLCLAVLVPLHAFARNRHRAPPAATPPPATSAAAARWEARVDGLAVDVTETMERIAAGGSNPHRNDGTRFQNRERRLPQGHTYTEYVVPTPGVHGPGPRRIIVNEQGQAWYTPYHYDHFHPVEKR